MAGTIAMFSNCVKNGLQGRQGGGYMVQGGLKREEFQAIRDGWSICEKTHSKIESLVLDLLTISKERQPNRQAVDLRKIVQDVLSIASVSANEQQVTLLWNPPDQLPDAWCDAEGLHRAILNLVVNAIDATEGKTERIVTIRLGHQAAKEDRCDFTITVEDNGAGIDEADFDLSLKHIRPCRPTERWISRGGPQHYTKTEQTHDRQEDDTHGK